MRTSILHTSWPHPSHTPTVHITINVPCLFWPVPTYHTYIAAFSLSTCFYAKFYSSRVQVTFHYQGLVICPARYLKWPRPSAPPTQFWDAARTRAHSLLPSLLLHKIAEYSTRHNTPPLSTPEMLDLWATVHKPKQFRISCRRNRDA